MRTTDLGARLLEEQRERDRLLYPVQPPPLWRDLLLRAWSGRSGTARDTDTATRSPGRHTCGRTG